MQDPAFEEEWSHAQLYAEECSVGEQYSRKQGGGPGGTWNVPPKQRQQMGSHAVVMYFQIDEGSDSPLLCTGEVRSGALGWVLGSSMQERRGHNEDCPAKGHEDDEKMHHLSYEKRPILDANI